MTVGETPAVGVLPELFDAENIAFCKIDGTDCFVGVFANG